jgi:hypothetical protein
MQHRITVEYGSDSYSRCLRLVFHCLFIGGYQKTTQKSHRILIKLRHKLLPSEGKIPLKWY